MIGQIQYEHYVQYIKLFKVKGDPYVVILPSGILIVVDEALEVIWTAQLPPEDSIPAGRYIACRLKEFVPNGNICDLHIYNYIMSYINHYLADYEYNKLDDDIGDKIYSMKSSDNMSLLRYHIEDDINKDFIISVSYGLFSLAKGDVVDNYVKDNNGKSFILKSIVHKSKQKIDITCYHKFLML